MQRYIDAAERVVAPPRETVDEDGASADEREGASDDGAGTLPGIGVTIAPDVPGVGDLDDLIDATFPGDPRGAGDLEPPGDPGGDLSDEAETLLGLPLPPPTLEDPLGDLLGDFAPVPELDALLYPNGPAGPRYTFPPAPEEGAPAVAADALRAEMQRWQRDLQAEGVIAHSAAEVFNNHQQELSSRFGLSAQQATEALGGSYSNRVGQRITGSAIVGPAIVGPKIVGPAIVGPGIVGEGIVGPCLDASCPNWGRINGFASAPSAPSAVTSGGSAPVWNPPAVRAPAGGSRVQPAPAAPAAPSAVRRPEHDTVAAPRPQPQPQQQPNWVQQAGQAAWDVLTYPHPLDPVRGAWRDAWRYLPGIGPAGQREFAH